MAPEAEARLGIPLSRGKPMHLFRHGHAREGGGRDTVSNIGIEPKWRVRIRYSFIAAAEVSARQAPKGVDCPAIDGVIKEADEVAG